MDEAPEPDQYEERLKEVFDGFDASAAGSLSPEELSALCHSLQLGEATPTLLHTLLQNQDGTALTGRVHFHQFKNALIQVLSSTMDGSSTQCPHPAPEPPPPAESPEIQPKFVKGSKRYGRRSTPEFVEPLLDSSGAVSDRNAAEENAGGDNEDEDSAVPPKRERCNPVHETSTEEYEAEGQMTLWNPDEPGTPQGSGSGGPLSQRLEVRLQEACEDLSLPLDGPASLADLLGLADHLGLEATGDVIQSVREAGGEVNVKEFVCRVVKHSQPPTPSSSTPYRQLKRLHSIQPFDEAGRRIATPSMMTGSIGLRLFSTLDDGTGHAPVENLLDAWLDEGIENTPEILKALDFSVEGRVNLGELTCALENELLVTRNGLHQAALASFKTEIRHLLERLDLELQQKERLLLDLEKAERLKSQLAAEVDENHSVIERSHHLHLRKLEQEHKEKLGAVRSELLTELDQIQQQANLQREELEAEVEKTRADESFMRDHLSISIKENRRLEMEVLDGNKKLAAAQVQISKLQASLENVLREKFGDLDPGSSELLRQEERFKQLCSGYEAQCRELQDRIDELQSEQALHRLGRRTQPCSKPLSDDLESKSPGMESDPGLGTEEGQPFNMSLEAEMMLEQLKEQHGHRVEDLQAQLGSKIQELDQRVEEQRVAHQAQKASISSQHQEEIQALREQMSSLQTQLEQARLERVGLDRRQAEEREDLELQQEEEVATLRQRLLEAHTQVSDLEEQLATAVEDAQLVEKLKRRQALELRHLQEKQEVLLEARLEEERMRTQEEVTLLEEKAREEKEQLRLDHGADMSTRLEEAQLRFEEEKEALVERLTEEWRRERTALEEQSNQTLQEVLEAGMLQLVKEQEEKESQLREQWEEDRVRLQKAQEEALLTVLAKERLKLQEQQEQREKTMKEAWEEEKLQLEEDYEGMLQDRLKEEREKAEEEKEKEEKRFERMLKEETSRLEERHREAVKELSARHGEEREELGSALDRLREEIVQERSEISRLEEENVNLSQKMAALKDEDLKGTNADLLQKLEDFQKEKIEAENMADNFQKQIADLRARGHHLQEENVLLSQENGLLSQKNGQNSADVEEISQQLAELIQENERREAEPAKDKIQMAACVAALEAELTKTLEEAVRLEDKNVELEVQLSALGEKVTRADTMEDQLSQLLKERRTLDKESQALRSQLARAQEKVETLNGAVQTSTLQASHLKTDLRVTQQEKDALRQEVLSLHKQLQNAHRKVGSYQGSLIQDERCTKCLFKCNDFITVYHHKVTHKVVDSKVKMFVRQLETTMVSLKQQNHAGLVKVLEQENSSLKKQLEGKNNLSKSCGGEAESYGELESLRQENEVLKAQTARLSTQLIEAFQAQLVGLLPGSPHRAQRGPHRGEDPDNMQDERERKMKKMEERMREIELTLHNVKLLLRDKVAQLKDQLHKNGRADVLIQDLYVENGHLLKALQRTEQQQQMVQKKNYLLEQKISSLSKIVRDLSPAPPSPASYRSKCS
ncbi:unnamed protein product [Lota lota]